MLSYFISTAIPKFPLWFSTFATLISPIFYITTQIPDQDFKKIVTLVQKRTLPFVTTA